MNDKEIEAAKKTIGLDNTTKNIYANKIKEILIASNYPKEDEDKLQIITKIYNIPITKLEVDNKKLGIICKKTFNISVIGLLKEE